MSLGVSSVVPGTGTIMALMQPSMISHHSTTRGSMVKMRPPGFTPSPARALPMRFDRSPISRNVASRDVPSCPTQTIATLLGSRPHSSKTS